jgi:Thiamine pyrophosphate enzyme, central domain
LDEGWIIHSVRRARPAHIDNELIAQTADTLVGEAHCIPRNIIAVGLRGCLAEGNEDVGCAIMELAEALNAPVLTRLDAKGVVDELHPLAFGVVGVHGKPGMEIAASLISTSDQVICIGVDDETLLVCNIAGIQIRKVVEIEPDAFGLSTRFDAEHTLVGNVADICKVLALKVETQTTIRNRKLKLANATPQTLTDPDDEAAESREVEKFQYMTFQNPNATVELSGPAMRRLSSIAVVPPPTLTRLTTVPNIKEFARDAMKIWNAFHTGNVSGPFVTQYVWVGGKEDQQNYVMRAHDVSLLLAVAENQRSPRSSQVLYGFDQK